MSNYTELSFSALWNLLHSLFQDKFTGGVSPFLATSQGLVKFPFSAGSHIPYCRLENFFYFNSCGTMFWGIKEDTFLHPH